MSKYVAVIRKYVFSVWTGPVMQHVEVAPNQLKVQVSK